MEQLQSEQINELVAALAKAQGEITPAIKDSSNPYFKSKYADLTSVWSACRGALSANGLAVVQGPATIDGAYYMVTTLCHSSGQWMRSFTPILSAKMDAQGIGAAMTYTRRYGLAAIVGVVADVDDDAESIVVRDGAAAPKKPRVPKPPTLEQNIDALRILLDAEGIDTGPLNSYILSLAADSTTPMHRIVEQALDPQYLTRFRGSYVAWLDSAPGLSEQVG